VKNYILRLLMFCLIGFGIVLILSLVHGTSSFNKYCTQAQAGDWGGALSVYGPERSGFLGCTLDTLSINFSIIFFGIYLLQYLAQIYLIAVLNRRKYLMHIWIMVVMIFLLSSLSYLATSIFPHVSTSFFDGQVRVDNEPIFAGEILSFSIRSGFTMASIGRFILQIIFLLLFLFSGPITVIWGLNRFNHKLKLKPSFKLFIYAFLVSLIVHISANSLYSYLIFINSPPREQLREIPREKQVFEFELPTLEPQYINITLAPQKIILYGE